MSGGETSAFELQVVPDGEGAYRLALWQRATPANGSPGVSAQRLATLGGVALQVGMDQVLDTLKREGHRASALSPSRREPLPLGEEAGVRLGLLFLALKPLRTVSRMEQIVAGLRRMPAEEAYYWFSKCAAGRGREHARRALRVLLAGG